MNRRCFPPKSSRGAVLLVVLACLALATSMFVLLVKQVGAERKELELNQRSLQAAWLAEAGVERAVAKLTSDAKYLGETWTVSAAELAGEDGGVVRIRVETAADKPERRTVRVEADYPDAPEQRCRQVKQIIVDRSAIQTPQAARSI